MPRLQWPSLASRLDFAVRHPLATGLSWIIPRSDSLLHVSLKVGGNGDGMFSASHW
jgi:hypothetical protein